MHSSKSSLEHLLSNYLLRTSSPDLVSQSDQSLRDSVQSFSFKELTDLSNTLQKKSLTEDYEPRRVASFATYIKQLLNGQLSTSKTVSSTKEVVSKISSTGKFSLSDDFQNDKDIRRVITVLSLNGLLERKNLSSKHNGLRALMELNLTKKIQESSLPINHERFRTPTKAPRDPNSLLGARSPVQTTQASRSLTHLNDSGVKSRSPNRSAIAALVNKRLDRSIDFTEYQTHNYQRKLGVQMLRKVCLMHNAQAFGKIKEAGMMSKFTEKNRGHFLSLLLKRGEINTKKRLAEAYFRWKSSCLTEPLAKGRLTNRIKGRLLMILSKQRSFLTLNTAFIRWKVRSDPSLMKIAVDRFALFSKINIHTAFWRLKTVLTKPGDVRRRQRRLEKLAKASIMLKSMIDKQVRKTFYGALSNIRDSIGMKALREKAIQALDKSAKRTLTMTFERWRQGCIQSLIIELRKVAVKGLIKGGDHRLRAFNKWKEVLYQGRIEQEKVSNLTNSKKNQSANYLVSLVQGLVQRRQRELLQKLRWESSQESHQKSLIMTRLCLAASNRYAEAFKIWRNSTLHVRQESKKRDALRIFEILKEGLRGNVTSLYTNSMENKQRIQALRRLTKMNKLGLASAMAQWKRNASLKDAYENVMAEKNKNSGQTLTLALTGTYQNNLRQAFNSIKREFEASKMKRKAMVSLVRSLTSKRRHAFNAWRIFSIQNKDQGRVVLLESLLKRLTNKAVKGAFEGLKSVVQEAEEQKKRHLWHMVYMLQRKQKKALDLWARNVKENSHVTACRATIKLVEIVNQALNKNISQVLATNKSFSAKVNAIRRLIEATKGKLKSGMDRWKKNMEMKKYKGMMETEKKAYMLKNLEGLVKNNQKLQLKDTFWALKDLENEEKLKKKAIGMAIKADNTRLRQAWDRWLTVPSKRAIKRQQTMNGIGLLMYNLIKNRKKEAFECLKEERQNMLEAKKECLRKIASSVVDKQKNCFNIWAQTMRAERQILRCKEAIGLFKTLNGVLKQQLTCVLVNDKEFGKKKSVIRKLQGNTNGRLKEAIDKWRSFMMLQKLGKDLQAQKRLMGAVQIHEMLTNINSNNLKDALGALKENKREVKAKKRFINALYKTRFGSLHRAFAKWKALPTKAELQRQGSANTLQLKLEKLQLIFKRTAFDALREPVLQAAQVKRDCIKTMIFLTSDKRKLAFKTWAKKTKDLKHIEASRGAIVLFETLSKTLKGNLDILIQDAGITKRKEKALKSLSVFSRFRKADAFRTWRTAAEMALWYDETINPTKYTRTHRSQGDDLTFEPYSETEDRDLQEEEDDEIDMNLTDRTRKSGILKPERIGQGLETSQEGGRGRDYTWEEPEAYKGEIIGEDQQEERARRAPKRFAATQGGVQGEWSSIGEQSPLGSLSSRRAGEFEEAFEEERGGPMGKKTTTATTGILKGAENKSARVTSRGEIEDREHSPLGSLSSRRTAGEGETSDAAGKKVSTSGILKGGDQMNKSARVTSRGEIEDREQSPLGSLSSRRTAGEGETSDVAMGKKVSTSGILKGGDQMNKSGRVTSRGEIEDREQSPLGSLSSRRAVGENENNDAATKKGSTSGILKGGDQMNKSGRVTSRGGEQSPLGSLSSRRTAGEGETNDAAGNKRSAAREHSPTGSSVSRRIGEFEVEGEDRKAHPILTSTSRGKKAVSIGEIKEREQSPVGSPAEGEREESKGDERGKKGPSGILRGSMSNKAGGETGWEDYDEKGERLSPHQRNAKKGAPREDTERNIFDDLLTTDRSANASVGGGTTMNKSTRGVKFEGLEGSGNLTDRQKRDVKGTGSLKEIAEEKGRMSTPERMRRAQTMKNAAMRQAVETGSQGKNTAGGNVGPLNMEGLKAIDEKPHKSMRSAFRAVGRAQTQKNMIVWAARSLRSTLTKLKYDALIRWRNYAKQGPQRAKIGRLLFGLIQHQKEKGIREAFGKIREQVETRKEKKKLGLERLVGQYVNIQRDAFEKWAAILDKEKQMKACNSVYQVFNVINSVLLNNTKTIYAPTYRSDKLRDVMRKLITSQKSKQKEAYWRWHDFSVQDRLIEASNSHIKTRNALEMAKLLDNKYKETLNDSFSRFKKIISYQSLQRKALLQIIRATKQRQAFYFHKLRWIAVLKRSEQTYNVAHILRTLENLVNNRKRGVLNALTGHSQDIQANKNVLLHSCLHRMTRPIHQAFSLWKHNNSLIKQASIMNNTRQIFDIIVQKQKENTLPLYHNKASIDVPAKTNHFERILQKLISQRQRSFFENLKQTLQNQDDFKKTLTRWANSQTKSDLQRAFITWKALLSDQRQSESNKNAFKIFSTISEALQLSTKPIFFNDKSLYYQKQMTAKMLLLTTRAKQAALFKQWRDSTQHENSLENALKFSKALTLCSTSRKSSLREALLRWNRASHTQEAFQNIQSKAENEILAIKLSNSASLLAQALSHLIKNTTRRGFYALKDDRQQRLKNAEILSRTLHFVLRGRLRDLFKQFKAGLWAKLIQENQDLAKISAGFARIQETLNKVERKALTSSLHHITLHILRRRKLMTIPQIISRLVARRQTQIFHSLKLTLFADKEKYQELKIKTFINHLKAYQTSLMRNTLSNIRGALLEKRKRDLIKKNLTVIWINHRIRPAMKQWRLKSRLSDQIHAAKFQNMLNLLTKSNQSVQRRALIKWSFRRGKNMIEILSLILKRIVTITQKEAFDEIINKVKLMRVRDRILAVQKMMKFSHLYEQSRIYRAYHLWHENAHNYNPWFKKAATLAAKNTPVNFQIAFWRLRDATQVAGSNLNASQIIQCKKIFNFIKVLYERSVGKAFWMIERTSRGVTSLTPTISMENLDRTSQGRSLDVVERRRTLDKKQDEEFTKRQIAAFALRRILRRLEDQNNRVKQGFRRWKLLTSGGRAALVKRATGPMRNYEVEFITKVGAVNIMYSHLKAHLQRNLKGSYDQIMNYSQIEIKAGTARSGKSPAGDGDEWDYGVLMQKYRELLGEYEEKCHHLENACESLNGLSAKLSAFMVAKFVKILERKYHDQMAGAMNAMNNSLE